MGWRIHFRPWNKSLTKISSIYFCVIHIPAGAAAPGGGAGLPGIVVHVRAKGIGQQSQCLQHSNKNTTASK